MINHTGVKLQASMILARSVAGLSLIILSSSAHGGGRWAAVVCLAQCWYLRCSATTAHILVAMQSTTSEKDEVQQSTMACCMQSSLLRWAWPVCSIIGDVSTLTNSCQEFAAVAPVYLNCNWSLFKEHALNRSVGLGAESPESKAAAAHCVLIVLIVLTAHLPPRSLPCYPRVLHVARTERCKQEEGHERYAILTATWCATSRVAVCASDCDDPQKA